VISMILLGNGSGKNLYDLTHQLPSLTVHFFALKWLLINLTKDPIT
jgi:ADP-glucose pyrophosphorylase